MAKKYVALLRGVNVGGKNTVPMPALRTALIAAGYPDAQTYLNSGNVIVSSPDDEMALQEDCHRIIAETFGLDIAVGVISGIDINSAIASAPSWWGTDPDSKHNAIFVIAPASAEEVCARVGEAKPEYESIETRGSVIFWSAPLATFSRTRWSSVAGTGAYQAITIRNANTARKLAELSAKPVN